MAELRGLGEISTALKEQGGRLLAIAVDPPEKARQVVERNRLDFSVLCDTERQVIGEYGLVHEGGGPDGTDIAVPAHILIDAEGRVVWRFVSRRVQDRPHPDEVVKAVRSVKKPPGTPPAATGPTGPLTPPTTG